MALTALEQRLWDAMQRRVLSLTPDMNKRLLDSFQALAKSMTDSEIRIALRVPDTFAETLITKARMERAFIGVRTSIAKLVGEAVLWAAGDLPGGGQRHGAVVVGFNVLDPRMIESIRTLDSQVMRTLADGIRETIRDTIREGITEGAGSAKMARQIRESVGLAPNQAQAVRNFERALREGDWSKALHYKLRDRRYDRTLLKEQKLTAAQIERMTAAYRRKFVAWNAQTNARTIVTDTQRRGKHLATQQAIEFGLLDGPRMFSRWVSTGDDRVRPLHREAHGEIVRFGDMFLTTEEIIPGESTFNCRCIKVDFQAKLGEDPRKPGGYYPGRGVPLPV